MNVEQLLRVPQIERTTSFDLQQHQIGSVWNPATESAEIELLGSLDDRKLPLPFRDNDIDRRYVVAGEPCGSNEWVAAIAT